MGEAVLTTMPKIFRQRLKKVRSEPDEKDEKN